MSGSSTADASSVWHPTIVTSGVEIDADRLCQPMSTVDLDGISRGIAHRRFQGSSSYASMSSVYRRRSASLEFPTSNNKRRRLNDRIDLDASSVSGWPLNRIPTEIFHLLTEHLSFECLGNCRLVCKEFEAKMSSNLFKTIVVPFTPELFSWAKSKVTSDMAFRCEDHSMKAFIGYGPRVKRFGLSFELDEDEFSSPPIKANGISRCSFWGAWLWPFPEYNRYIRPQRLESAADEHRSMIDAFTNLKHVETLALSLDNGLGWLKGPDRSERLEAFEDDAVVFGRTNRIARPSDQWRQARWNERFPEDLTPRLYMSVATQRLSAALDVRSKRLPRTRSGPTTVTLASRNAPLHFAPTHHPGIVAPSNAHPLPMVQFDLMDQVPADDPINGARGQLYRDRAPGLYEYGSYDNTSDKRHPAVPVVPRHLTTAQIEWLMETEWAQQAFLSCYARAVIDSHPTFHAVHTLIIGRLPSNQLSNLHRADFWYALPRLSSLTLHIIPEWRAVQKVSKHSISLNAVKPSAAIANVYALLKNHIAPIAHLKTLNIGWASGGELSHGIFARNNHILAAPILPEATDMFIRTPIDALTLPYIESLTLHNTWAAPHHLLSFLAYHARQNSLKHITLTSVSLTAPIPATTPGPYLDSLPPCALPQPIQSYLHALALPPPEPVNPPSPPFTAVGTPRPGSWAELIQALDPRNTLTLVRHVRRLVPQCPKPRPDPKLVSLTFESCGYVVLPKDWDQSAVTRVGGKAKQPPEELRLHARLLGPLMMRTDDAEMGTVVPGIRRDERRALALLYGIREGWPAAWAGELKDAAMDLCGGEPGRGRFSGGVGEGVDGGWWDCRRSVALHGCKTG